jgi:hypothetical protein
MNRLPQMRSLFHVSILLFALAFVTSAHAQPGCANGCGVPAPEIDPSLGAGALAFLAGTVLVIRGQRKRL